MEWIHVMKSSLTGCNVAIGSKQEYVVLLYETEVWVHLFQLISNAPLPSHSYTWISNCHWICSFSVDRSTQKLHFGNNHTLPSTSTRNWKVGGNTSTHCFTDKNTCKAQWQIWHCVSHWFIELSEVQYQYSHLKPSLDTKIISLPLSYIFQRLTKTAQF